VAATESFDISLVTLERFSLKTGTYICMFIAFRDDGGEAKTVHSKVPELYNKDYLASML
jgi:hypothetical protein